MTSELFKITKKLEELIDATSAVEIKTDAVHLNTDQMEDKIDAVTAKIEHMMNNTGTGKSRLEEINLDNIEWFGYIKTSIDTMNSDVTDKLNDIKEVLQEIKTVLES